MASAPGDDVRRPSWAESLGASASLLDDRAMRPSLVEPSHNEFLGVSVHHLSTDFVHQVRQAGLSTEANFHQIEPKVVRPLTADVMCPTDGKLGASYVDSISGPFHVGQAQYMLSYTWTYAVRDIVDPLVKFCRDSSLETRNIPVWICCLCINQHRVTADNDVPFEVFRSVFERRVRSIGHVIALMSPWQKPLYVRRLWCIFELFNIQMLCDKDPNTYSVSIVLPPREVENLRCSLMQGQGLNDVWRALANLKVEEAEATSEEDRHHILKMIEEGPGFQRFNGIVAKRLQAWIVEDSEKFFWQMVKAGDLKDAAMSQLCTQIGKLLTLVGKLDRAANVLEEGTRISSNDGSIESPVGAALLMQLGHTKQYQNDLTGAVVSFERARLIRQQSATLATLEGAELMAQLGNTKRRQGDLTGAAEACYMAKEIAIETGTLETEQGARMLRNYGEVQLKMKNFTRALHAFSHARDVRKQTATLETPDGANVLRSLGGAKHQMGDLQGAIESYGEARALLERTGTLQTLQGANMLHSLGIALQANADPKGATEMFLEAKDVLVRIGRLTNSPEGLEVLKSLAGARQCARSVAKARDRLRRATAVRRSVSAPTVVNLKPDTEPGDGETPSSTSKTVAFLLDTPETPMATRMASPHERPFFMRRPSLGSASDLGTALPPTDEGVEDSGAAPQAADLKSPIAEPSATANPCETGLEPEKGEAPGFEAQNASPLIGAASSVNASAGGEAIALVDSEVSSTSIAPQCKSPSNHDMLPRAVPESRTLLGPKFRKGVVRTPADQGSPDGQHTPDHSPGRFDSLEQVVDKGSMQVTSVRQSHASSLVPNVLQHDASGMPSSSNCWPPALMVNGGVQDGWPMQHVSQDNMESMAKIGGFCEPSTLRDGGGLPASVVRHDSQECARVFEATSKVVAASKISSQAWATYGTRSCRATRARVVSPQAAVGPAASALSCLQAPVLAESVGHLARLQAPGTSRIDMVVPHLSASMGNGTASQWAESVGSSLSTPQNIHAPLHATAASPARGVARAESVGRLQRNRRGYNASPRPMGTLPVKDTTRAASVSGPRRGMHSPDAFVSIWPPALNFAPIERRLKTDEVRELRHSNALVEHLCVSAGGFCSSGMFSSAKEQYAAALRASRDAGQW